MEMKNKVLNYMEDNEISAEQIAKALSLHKEKFQRNNDIDWSGEELLKICSYLKVEPMRLYEQD